MNHFLATMVNQTLSLQPESILNCAIFFVFESFGLSVKKGENATDRRDQDSWHLTFDFRSGVAAQAEPALDPIRS